MQKKKTVAIFTGQQGHFSIAQAIAHHLKHTYNVKMVYFEDDYINLYVPFYRLVPFAYQIPFSLSQNTSLTNFIRSIFQKKFYPVVVKNCKRIKPDICITTYCPFIPALEKFYEKEKTPFVNVIADPVTSHPLFIAPRAALNITFDQRLIENCRKFFPEAQYKATGWFTRQEFSPSKDKKADRIQLGLEPDPLTFLISSGSDGTSYILKILPTILQTHRPLQVIVVCGNNAMLFNSLQSLKKVVKKMNPNSKLLILPFTKKVDAYMRAADLIIGKAGPNTIFESVASLTPFFAITHISGQENGNLDLIRNNGLGFVEENPMKAQKLLRKIIQKPEILNGYTTQIKKMREYNNKAFSILENEIEKL